MKNVFLYYGEESYTLQKRIKELIKQYDIDEFNLVNYDLDESNLVDALRDAKTIPFISDKKAVIIKNINFSELDTMLENELLKYLENPPNSTLLFLMPTKLDYRLKIVKKIKELAEVKKFEKIDVNNMEISIRNYFKEINFQIESQAIQEIIKRADNDTYSVINELNKLALYGLDEKKITQKMVKELVSLNVEKNVFNLINAIVDKKINLALKIYYDLISVEDPIKLLSLIVSKFRELNYANILINNGYSKTEIMKFFNASSGRAYYIMENAKKVNLSYVKKQMEKLSDLDIKIKRGIVDKKIAVEMYLLSI